MGKWEYALWWAMKIATAVILVVAFSYMVVNFYIAITGTNTEC